MCSWTALNQNEQGYVMQCCDCNRVQMAFGTTVVSFTKDQFYDFYRMADVVHARSLNGFESRQHLLLPSASVGMVCTAQELKQLHELLKGGCSKLLYNDLLITYKN